MQRKFFSPHLIAILQSIFVTVLWSSSWVLIKIGLRGDQLPALTFAGLRYVLAFICLIPFVFFSRKQRAELRGLTRREWVNLALSGVVIYSLTQGLQFLSLAYLPAAMVSLLLNLTPVLVALLGIFFLRELPTPLQWVGVVITALGILIYFSPADLPAIQWTGFIFAVLCTLFNTASSIMGRAMNHHSRLSPLMITFVSMGAGSILLLLSGIIFQGVGALTWSDWLIIIWLAVVNTAFAFTLWNNTLRVLSAVESSILNSLMLPMIAVLAVVFLNENLDARQIGGLALSCVGILLVQVKNSKFGRGA
ncbi:MAG: DMT family transporter [Anaerolineae bacterium]|nr:DMT family transporter [Anaerolineae bacterium]